MQALLGACERPLGPLGLVRHAPAHALDALKCRVDLAIELLGRGLQLGVVGQGIAQRVRACCLVALFCRLQSLIGRLHVGLKRMQLLLDPRW